MHSSLHHLVEKAAAFRGDAAALTYKDETLGYDELWRRSRAIGQGLCALGVTREERVAVFLETRLETVTSILGTSVAGAVFVPVNPLLRPAQVAYMVNNCQVSVLVTSRERLALLEDDLKGCGSLNHVVVVDDSAKPQADGLEGLPYRVHVWSDVFTDLVSNPPDSPVIDQDPAAILYTSGSTGKPKGVVLSHRNLIVGALSVGSYLENTADDVILAALPISFDAGLSQLTTAFGVGAHVVLMNYLLPRDVPRLCSKHRVTGLTCVPPLWIQLAGQTWPAESKRSLRYFANTGGRMPRSTLATLRGHFPQAKPYLMYGLTEAFRSTYLDPAEVDRRPDSIGKAIPNAEILVVRPDGSRCGPGEEGELVHRGALVALGYWDDPQRTAERFRPVPGSTTSWRAPELAVWSGDSVVADEDGFLYFVGRRDEMIKTSGYRVSPTEVEEVAYDSGLVRDAVALGVSDPAIGQRIVLVVAPVDAASFQTDHLLAVMRRELPTYMVPSHVQVRDQIPRSPNGKFDRSRLAQELAT
jgi:acyl-CoA ligase (AMP-forming) (exosortase A-associated)